MRECWANMATARCCTGRARRPATSPVVEVARQMWAASDRGRSKPHRHRGAPRRRCHNQRKRGATWFGVGAGLARIAQAIEDDERALLTCSMLTQECQGVGDVALSLPRVIGAAGVVKTFAPDLDAGERAALEAERRNTEGGGRKGALLKSQRQPCRRMNTCLIGCPNRI